MVMLNTKNRQEIKLIQSQSKNHNLGNRNQATELCRHQPRTTLLPRLSLNPWLTSRQFGSPQVYFYVYALERRSFACCLLVNKQTTIRGTYDNNTWIMERCVASGASWLYVDTKIYMPPSRLSRAKDWVWEWECTNARRNASPSGH